MHIAITGNIGAGKSTLVTMLGDYYGWDVLYEAVDENPYLKDFYADMERWAFHLQIYFLNSRFRQVIRIKERTRPIIQDRTIYEDASIFATNLFRSGLMPQRDFESYIGIFDSMSSLVEPPDLLIYLQADIPTLMSQIRKRGRDFELNISVDYLSDLNAHYEEWIKSYDKGKLLIFDVTRIDFVANPADFQHIIQAIEAALPAISRRQVS